MKFTYNDIILVPKFNPFHSRKEVSTKVSDKRSKLSLGVPIMTANMDSVTGYTMANAISKYGGVGTLHRFCNIEDNIEMFKKSPSQTFVSVGCSDSELERAEALRDAGAEFFCIDIAHGHSASMRDMLTKMRAMLPNACIMAGNVATVEACLFLQDLGADIVKVGIGPGSVCSTRTTTGFGMPQASAVSVISRHPSVRVSIVADGGIKTSGDVVKALALGADFVMIGSMFAGTEVCPGTVDSEGFMVYRGMASHEAYEDFFGEKIPVYKTSEGVSRRVKVKSFDKVMQDLIGGLRSGMTYGGASNLEELKNVSYEIISNSSHVEGTPHF